MDDRSRFTSVWGAGVWWAVLVLGLFGPATAHGQKRLGGEFQVNTHTSSYQRRPAVAMDGAGNFVVVWDSNDQDGDGLGIFARRFNSDGAPLGGEFQVNSYTTNAQFDPSVAMNETGAFVVIWSSALQDGSSTGVFGQRYAADGEALEDEFPVNTTTGGQQDLSSVAMDEAGNFVVVWRDAVSDGNLSGIFARRFDSGSSPLSGELQVNTYTTYAQNFPSVAMDDAGNFIVAWDSHQQEGLPGYGVFGQRYDSGGSPDGTEFPINSYSPSDQRFPSVAMDDDGDFVVVWQSAAQDGALLGVFAQRLDSDGSAQDGEFQVNTNTFGNQYRPVVAMDGLGNFTVAWESFGGGQDGSYGGIYDQRYTAGGAAIGGEFQVNTHTTLEQSRPAVAMDGSGRFVVVWESLGQDGSFTGIFGQRFRFGELEFFISDDEERADARLPGDAARKQR